MIFQAVAAPAPIHVIVDHVASTPGLPVWVTTLISAGIGFIFGILSNSLMEFVRPMLARLVLMHEIKRDLLRELTSNIKRVRTAWDDLSQKPPKDVLDWEARHLMAQVELHHFNFYQEKHPAALYDFDQNKALRRFYNIFTKRIPGQLKAQKDGWVGGQLIPEELDDELFKSEDFLVRQSGIFARIVRSISRVFRRRATTDEV
jgi:hypothetical protein